MIQLRDLSRQYRALCPRMEHALLETAASGNYIMGQAVENIEDQLAKYVGVKHCVSCANGTDALLMALLVTRIGEGDAVFVPDFTFFATAEVVSRVGATPVFVDVNPDTYNISVSDLQLKIEAVLRDKRLKPRMIISVDLFGQPADYEALRRVALYEHMLLLEDAAQGFGGAIGARRACSFGDLAATSFFPAKPLGCYGDGGALFTDRDDWANEARSLRQHGRGEQKYDNVRIGLNSRLDAVQAAVLDVKLDAFKHYELNDVQLVAKQYDTLLSGIDGITLPTVPNDYLSSWAQYTVRFEDERLRQEVRNALTDCGIASAIYYPKPMHQQSAFFGVPQFGNNYNAEMLTHQVLSLPMHPYLSECEVDMIARIIAQCCKGRRM